MKKVVCLLLIVALLPLCGCEHRLELCLMVVSLGIDVDESGMRLSIKSSNYAAGAQGDQEEKSDYVTLSARGSDWQQAMTQLLREAAIEVSFGQLREVIVSVSSLDYAPAAQLLQRVNTLQNVRSHALVVFCAGSAYDFVRAQQPTVGKRLSKYLDNALNTYSLSGAIPDTTLAVAMRDLTGPWIDPLLAYAAPEEQGAGYAGALAIGKTGYTYLSAYETQLYCLIMGREQALLFPYEGAYYAVESAGRVRLTSEGRGAQTRLTLSLPVVFLYSAYETPPGAGIGAALAADIQALLEKLQAAQCDPLGFGCQAARQYPSLYAWLAADWKKDYQTAALAVSVTAKTRQQDHL